MVAPLSRTSLAKEEAENLRRMISRAPFSRAAPTPTSPPVE